MPPDSPAVPPTHPPAALPVPGAPQPGPVYGFWTGSPQGAAGPWGGGQRSLGRYPGGQTSLGGYQPGSQGGRYDPRGSRWGPTVY